MIELVLFLFYLALTYLRLHPGSTRTTDLDIAHRGLLFKSIIFGTGNETPWSGIRGSAPWYDSSSVVKSRYFIGQCRKCRYP